MSFWRAGMTALLVFCIALCAAAQSSGDSGGGFPADALKEVLSGGEFGGQSEERWALRPKDEPERAAPFSAPAEWLDFFNKIASHLGRALLIVLVSALLVVCVIFGRKPRPLRRRKRAVRVQSEEKIRRASADALLAGARRAFDEGRPREAWTYCYRSALAALEDAGLAFPPSATEYECLRGAARRFPALTAPMRTLVENRVKSAYRAEEANPPGFIESAAFCEELILGRFDRRS